MLKNLMRALALWGIYREFKGIGAKHLKGFSSFPFNTRLALAKPGGFLSHNLRNEIFQTDKE